MSTAKAGQFSPYGALPIPHFAPEYFGLIKRGKVYSLSVIWNEGIPVPAPMVPYTLSPRLRHGDLPDIAPASAAAELVTMAAHTGTHIDALCHIGEVRDGDVKLYAGENQVVSAADHVTYQGQTHLSIVDMPPILTRAVLIDVAGYKGVDVLPDAYVIPAADIQGALAAQQTVITPGTAVLIRTGFHQHLVSGSLAYRDAIAGIGLEAAQWLHEQGMTLAGADNMTVEAMPPMDHAVHRYLLVKHGITHLENLYLEELAAGHIYECLLIVTPLRLQGATGSWVHPIAIA
ncbi:MAG: cyclase family protein [Chloroflexi bacterium]|nr:cyclase family protein [Chloroflexota bacterium]MCC6894600.1 cyclase family protein [Anaerolineae bacterium]